MGCGGSWLVFLNFLIFSEFLLDDAHSTLGNNSFGWFWRQGRNASEVFRHLPLPGSHSCPTARRSGKKRPLEAALVLGDPTDPGEFWPDPDP